MLRRRPAAKSIRFTIVQQESTHAVVFPFLMCVLRMLHRESPKGTTGNHGRRHELTNSTPSNPHHQHGGGAPHHTNNRQEHRCAGWDVLLRVVGGEGLRHRAGGAGSAGCCWLFMLSSVLLPIRVPSGLSLSCSLSLSLFLWFNNPPIKIKQRPNPKTPHRRRQRPVHTQLGYTFWRPHLTHRSHDFPVLLPSILTRRHPHLWPQQFQKIQKAETQPTSRWTLVREACGCDGQTQSSTQTLQP